MSNFRFLTSGFIEVDITKDMIKQAEDRNASLYSKYGNSGTHRGDKGRQRMTGFLAEMAVKSYFTKMQFSDDDSVDFICNGVTFDVKSQGCNGAPELKFVGTLYEEQAKRNADFYIFCRTKNDSSKVWITGFISKKKFMDLSTLQEAGTKNSNFSYDQSRYEIPYFKLIKCKELVEAMGLK